MGVWISENWLALYGSVVGTIALFVNLSRHFQGTARHCGGDCRGNSEQW